MSGGTGTDRLFGGPDDDVLETNSDGDNLGAELADGEDGKDKVIGGNGVDNLLGGAGDDLLVAGSGANSSASLIGNTGNDVLWGGPNADELNGGGGDDFLHGMGGPDDLEGGSGSDVLIGGDGGDTLDGESGDDMLWQGDEGDASAAYSSERLVGGGGHDWLNAFSDQESPENNHPYVGALMWDRERSVLVATGIGDIAPDPARQVVERVHFHRDKINLPGPEGQSSANPYANYAKDSHLGEVTESPWEIVVIVPSAPGLYTYWAIPEDIRVPWKSRQGGDSRARAKERELATRTQHWR